MLRRLWLPVAIQVWRIEHNLSVGHDNRNMNWSAESVAGITGEGPWRPWAMTGHISQRQKIVASQAIRKTPEHIDRELAGIHRFEPISRSHEDSLTCCKSARIVQTVTFTTLGAGDDQQSGQHIDPITYRPKESFQRRIGRRGTMPLRNVCTSACT